MDFGNFVSTLCLAGLTEEEAMTVNNCAVDLRSFDTVDLQAEFMMFFVSWAHQGRTTPFNQIISDWEDLWSAWCSHASMFRIDPLNPHKYHTTLIEKLYARFPVRFDSLGLKKPRRK